MRFSIRSALLATAIVSMLLAWWADRERLLERMERLEVELRDARAREIQARMRRIVLSSSAPPYSLRQPPTQSPPQSLPR